MILAKVKTRISLAKSFLTQCKCKIIIYSTISLLINQIKGKCKMCHHLFMHEQVSRKLLSTSCVQ